MTVPNFLLVGAAKSGTTSLYNYLSQHPDVFMSIPKEPNFFVAQFVQVRTHGPGHRFVPRIVTFSDYCALFRHADGKRAIGEASVRNLYYYEQTIPLIKQHVGDPNILIILRNPVERAFSAYTYLLRFEEEPLSFEDALRQEEQRRRAEWEFGWLYQDVGRYAQQVHAYLTQFSSVKIVLFDDLLRNPIGLLQELYAFLGVDASFCPDTKHRFNPSGTPQRPWMHRMVNHVFRRGRWQMFPKMLGKWLLGDEGWIHFRERVRATLLNALLAKPQMRQETRRMLMDVFAEDIEQLQALLQRDLSHWLAVDPVKENHT